MNNYLKLSITTVLSVLYILLSAANIFAQPTCSRVLTYLIRNENGQIMTSAETQQLTIQDINGVALKLQKNSPDADGRLPYEYESAVNRYQELRPERFQLFNLTSNPLRLPSDSYPIVPCSNFGEMTLRYGGKQMKLLFDIGEFGSVYGAMIDSLPFQEGTFHLRSTQCKEGAIPPVADKLNISNCLVAADNWEGMNKDWVRHLQWNDFNGGQINTPGFNCNNQPMKVISRQKDWEAAWRDYRGVRPGNPLPPVDFKTEVVLVGFLPKAPPALGYDSLFVDKKGNLTFHPLPPPENYYQKACSVALLTIYRSGIKSVEGKLLLSPSDN